MAEDFELEEAREEAARAVFDIGTLSLFALEDGTTPAAVRRRLLRFVAGVALTEQPSPRPTPAPAPPSLSARSLRGSGSASGASPPLATAVADAVNDTNSRRMSTTSERAPIISYIRRPSN